MRYNDDEIQEIENVETEETLTYLDRNLGQKSLNMGLHGLVKRLPFSKERVFGKKLNLVKNIEMYTFKLKYNSYVLF